MPADMRTTNRSSSTQAAKKSNELALIKLNKNRRTSLNSNGSNLPALTMVVLDSCLIRMADTAEEIERTCPRITELDLSRNLFEGLGAVAEICGPLKMLRSLRLTGNRFSEITLAEESQGAFCRVEWLALNMCALYWDEVPLS
jgi:hypothetical protein